MKPYKLFIFDWDGTLMDSSEVLTNSMLEVAKNLRLSYQSSEAIKATFGLPLTEIIKTLYPQADTTLFAKLFYADYAKNGSKANPFDKVGETLEFLYAKGCHLAIATNKIRSELKNILQQLNWERFFCATRCGDDAFVKPNPEVVLSLLKELSFSREEAVLIGDSSYDMQTAAQANIDSIAVCHGVHSKAKLLSFNPILCVNNFAELHALINLSSG